MDAPLVSVLTLAYNHAPFIRQCIEGVLMQKTTFSFELLIHDDASKDETADIIREYEALYPEIIKGVYQTENQYSKDIDPFDILFLKAQGKYIAICEGDDYWTNPLKLQKQCDFLEAHPDYIICGGRYWELREGDAEPIEPDWVAREMNKFPKGKNVNFQNFLYPYTLQFLTVCFRKDYQIKEEYYQIENSKDDTLYAILLEQGKGFVFPDYFGVYRRHKDGMWAGMIYEDQLRSNMEYRRELVKYFGNKSKSVRIGYFETCITLWFIELKKSKQVFTDYMKIVRFTLSGNKNDIFTFHIWYTISKSTEFFKTYFKNLLFCKKKSK